jgi:hypothetical protein
MHPGGIGFGLSQGLLELNGDKVVVSAPFLKQLSEIARRWVRRRKRVMDVFDDTRFRVEEAAIGLRRSLAVSAVSSFVPD